MRFHVLAPVFLLTVLAAPATHAMQDSPPAPDDFWITAGLGVGSEDFAGNLGLAYQHGVHLFSLRTAATTGLFDDGFGDLGLLYGRATTPDDARHSRMGAAVGIAVVDGCIEAGEGSLFGSCVDQPAVIGLPIEVQLTWLPARFFGVGLYGFADLNQTRSFAGLTLSVQLGRVR